jgi:hypothetical protein
MDRRFGRAAIAVRMAQLALAGTFALHGFSMAQAEENPQARPDTNVVTIENPEVFTNWLLPENYPRIDRAVNVMSAHTTRAHALNLVVDHRTLQPVQTRPFQDWAGFDAGGLKIGLALRYGILDNLEVGALRLSNGYDVYDTYQFDVKYWAFDAAHAGVDVAIRAGGTWYYQSPGPDSGGGFAQLIVSRSFLNRLWLSSGLYYDSNASNDDHPVLGHQRTTDQAYALAIPAALELRLRTFLAWDVEGIFNVAGNHAKYPVLSTAVKFITYRHTFALIVSNSQYIGADGLVANTTHDFHQLIVGFTITREFDF